MCTYTYIHRHIHIHTTNRSVTVLSGTGSKDLRMPACLRFPASQCQSRNYHSVVKMKWSSVHRLLSLLWTPNSHCPYPQCNLWLEYLHEQLNFFLTTLPYGRHITSQKAPTEVKIVGDIIAGNPNMVTVPRKLLHTHTCTCTLMTPQDLWDSSQVSGTALMCSRPWSWLSPASMQVFKEHCTECPASPPGAVSGPVK